MSALRMLDVLLWMLLPDLCACMQALRGCVFPEHAVAIKLLATSSSLC